MTYNFSYQEIMEICPVEAEIALSKIRKGKSKSKDLLPEEFDWSIILYQRGHACSIDEMLRGEKPEELPFEYKYFTAVQVKKKVVSTCSLTKVPDVIVAKLVERQLLK